MEPNLKSLLLGKQDLHADKLPEEYDFAFLGWSMYQPHHHLPSPVYDLDLLFKANLEHTPEYLYDTFVRNKKKTFAPIFVGREAVTRKDLIHDNEK
jgi:hypothetical protein